jgi:hypothetical protein
MFTKEIRENLQRNTMIPSRMMGREENVHRVLRKNCIVHNSYEKKGGYFR